MTSPSTSRFSNWPRAARAAGTRTPRRSRRDAEQEERPPPAVVAAGERRDPGDDDRAERPDDAALPIGIDALMRPRTPIGYVSAISEPCTGIVFDFAIADAEAGPEQLERVHDETARATTDRRTRRSPIR